MRATRGIVFAAVAVVLSWSSAQAAIVTNFNLESTPNIYWILTNASGGATYDLINDQVEYKVFQYIGEGQVTMSIITQESAHAAITRVGYYQPWHENPIDLVNTALQNTAFLVGDVDAQAATPLTLATNFVPALYQFGVLMDDRWYDAANQRPSGWYPSQEEYETNPLLIHAAVFRTKDAQGEYIPYDYIVAFEDKQLIGDADYNDIVIRIQNVEAVPEPSTAVLAMLTMLGIGAWIRRRSMYSTRVSHRFHRAA